MGVLADAVSQVVELHPDDIEKPPAFGTQIHTDYLLGMGKAGKRLVLMLDIDEVLSTDELLVTAETAVASGEEPEADSSGAGPAQARAEANSP